MPSPFLYDTTQGGMGQDEHAALGNAATQALLSAGNVANPAIHPTLAQPDEHDYIYRLERGANTGDYGSGQR